MRSESRLPLAFVCTRILTRLLLSVVFFNRLKFVVDQTPAVSRCPTDLSHAVFHQRGVGRVSHLLVGLRKDTSLELTVLCVDVEAGSFAKCRSSLPLRWFLAEADSTPRQLVPQTLVSACSCAASHTGSPRDGAPV